VSGAGPEVILRSRDPAPAFLRLGPACLVWLAVASRNAWAGGAGFGDPDEHAPDEGPHYYGFVRDERGAPLGDARVTATHKTLSLVTRSAATGVFRLRGFKNDIDPKEVTISCSKEGYAALRVSRRPPPRGKPVTAIETECRLKRQS
jgi:hypothetical protein